MFLNQRKSRIINFVVFTPKISISSPAEHFTLSHTYESITSHCLEALNLLKVVYIMHFQSVAASQTLFNRYKAHTIGIKPIFGFDLGNAWSFYTRLDAQTCSVKRPFNNKQNSTKTNNFTKKK